MNYTVLLGTFLCANDKWHVVSGDSVTLESKKIGEETIFDCPLNQHTCVPPAVTSSAQQTCQ